MSLTLLSVSAVCLQRRHRARSFPGSMERQLLQNTKKVLQVRTPLHTVHTVHSQSSKVLPSTIRVINTTSGYLVVLVFSRQQHVMCYCSQKVALKCSGTFLYKRFSSSSYVRNKKHWNSQLQRGTE